MRRFFPIAPALALGTLLSATTLQGQSVEAGSSIRPLRPPPSGTYGHIIDSDFTPVTRSPESGQFTYTITVKNMGANPGIFTVYCSSAQGLPCLEPSPNSFHLASAATRVVTVGYTASGLGHFSQTFNLEVNDSITDSHTYGLITVAGPAIQMHQPADQQQISQHDSLIITYSDPSGVDSMTFRVLMNGHDSTAHAQRHATSLRWSAAGFTARTDTLTSYGCAVNGRCDSLTTIFTFATAISYSMDDSLPPGLGGLESPILPGGLPLPPFDQRGCPTAYGYPDIRLGWPVTFFSQPETETTPAGYIFMAGVVWTDTLEIEAITIDNPIDNGRICTDGGGTIPFLDWNQYDWNFWTHTDPNDPLWDSYPYGDRGSGLRSMNVGAGTHRPEEASTASVPGPAQARTQSGGGVVHPMIGDPGAINPSTYWVTLNDTFIVRYGQPVHAGVTLVSISRSGSAFRVPASIALMHRYDYSNPTADNGGWNEVIAGISDSSGHETRIRARFAVTPQTQERDIAVTPLRDFRHQEQGDCAAFGSFQCGGVTLVQPVPGFVTRDRDRSLHLVYRSASQRAAMAVPYRLDLPRDQTKPDSIRVSITGDQGAQLTGSLVHHYAGARCAGSGCGGYSLLLSHSDEHRVIAGHLPAPATGDTLRAYSAHITAYYAGPTPHENSLTQDVVQLYWTDTVRTRFGAGWNLAELGRLLFFSPPNEPPAVVYARGDGSFSVYRYVGGAYVSPPGDRSRLVMRDDPDSARYTIWYPGGTAVGFRANGLQLFTRDLVGNKTYFRFTDTRLDSILDRSGASYKFLYNASGQVSEMQLRRSGIPNRTVLSLRYDGQRRLDSVTVWADDSHADTTVFTYVAGAPGAFVATVTDPRHQVTDFAYQDTLFWMPTKVIRPPLLGYRDSALYRDPLRRAAPRAGNGHDGEGQERLLFPNQARGTYVPFAGTPTDVEVDAFGAATMVRHFAPAGVWVADELRNIDRDSTGRVTKIVAGRDYYGANADSVMYEYDAQGNLAGLIRTTAAYPIQDGNTLDTVAYAYDSVIAGLPDTLQRCVRMRTTRDPMGGVDSVGYGPSGVAQCLPQRMRGMAGDTTHFFYGDLSVGTPSAVRPVAVVDATGRRDSVAYDAATWNSVAHVRVADGAASRVRHFNEQGRADSIADALGRITVIRMDRLGRVLRSRTGTGITAAVTANFYGPGGLVDSVRVYGTNGESLDNPPVGRIQTTKYYYDALGWSDSSRTPGDSLGANRRLQHWQRDRLGQVYLSYTGHGAYSVRIRDYAGRVTTEALSQVRPGYSVDGLPFADAATTALYNFYQLAPGVTLHAGEGHLYYYDEQGRLTSTVDSMVTTQRTYTPRGAVTSESFLFRDGATVGRTYTYNRRGQRVAAVDTVRQGSTGLGGGRIDYTWNATTGRLDSMTGRRSGAAYASVAFLYDLAGRDTSRAVNLYGGGGLLRVRTQYDALGRVSRLTDTSAAGAWYRFDASAAGRYDAADVLHSYTFSEPGPGGGPGSNVAGTMSMVYDSANGTGRLLESHRDATNGPDYMWTYDVFGNRTVETCHSTWQGVCQKTEPATYGPDNTLRKRKNTELASTPVSMYWTDQAGNRLMQTDSVNGQPASSPSALLSYTALSQLFFAMTPTVQVGTYDYVWHWYDGQGRRVVTHGQQGSTWMPGTAPSFTSGTRYYYVYDGADVAIVLAHAGSQWWVHQRQLSGGVDQPLAGWFYSNGGSTSGALALVADQQGSVRAAVKPDGNRDDLAPYFGRNAWGALEGASGTGGGSGATNTQTGYTGASSPTVTGGFTYLRNRWYDPATGRFLTQDPIGLAGGVNLYAYAGGNPVGFSDPFGLWIEPLGVDASQAIERLRSGSATFRRIYDALKQADQSRVSVVIRQGRTADELAYIRGPGNNAAYSHRDPHSPDGRILFNPAHTAGNMEDWLGHEIVHLAGQYADEVGGQTDVPGGCGAPHQYQERLMPAAVVAKCRSVEQKIRAEMDASNGHQESRTPDPEKR
jgi:RHS repeat-associated protein